MSCIRTSSSLPGRPGRLLICCDRQPDNLHVKQRRVLQPNDCGYGNSPAFSSRPNATEDRRIAWARRLSGVATNLSGIDREVRLVAHLAQLPRFPGVSGMSSGGQVEFSRVRDELMLRPTMPAVEHSRQKVPVRNGFSDNVSTMTFLKRDKPLPSPEFPAGLDIRFYRGAGVAFAAGG